MKIARERIAKEAEEKTGFLDLGRLGLTELPDEIGELKHLLCLSLGEHFVWKGEGYYASSFGERNRLASDQIGKLQRLQQLEAIWIWDTDIEGISEINGMPNLRTLAIAGSPVRCIDVVATIPTLERLHVIRTEAQNLDAVASISQLRELNLHSDQIDDLSVLGNHKNLEKLSVWQCEAKDLSVLRELPELRELLLGKTNARDFTPVASLQKLKKLDINRQRNFDVGVFFDMPGLEELYFEQAPDIDITPIGCLSRLKVLNLCFSKVTDFSPIRHLHRLEELSLQEAPIKDLTFLSNLPSLTKLEIPSCQITDLGPLTNLGTLEELQLQWAPIKDIRPLKNLTNLKKLILQETPVSDLSPLSTAVALRELNISRSSATDLSSLKNMKALEELNAASTGVHDLEPLSRLHSLKELTLSSTKVRDFKPLSGLSGLVELTADSVPAVGLDLADMPSLKRIDITDSQVSDISCMSNLPELEVFYANGTGIWDLAAISALTALKYLELQGCPVQDLTPLVGHPSLECLNIRGCVIKQAPKELWWNPAFDWVLLDDGAIPGVSEKVFFEHAGYGDQLGAIRAYLKNQEVPDQQVENTLGLKVLVFGNEKVGKSEICRHLAGSEFGEVRFGVDGVSLRLAPMPGASDGELGIWEFAGQDYHHSTHSQFADCFGIFVIVWNPDDEPPSLEGRASSRVSGHSLLYWLEFVKHFGDAMAPIIIVQSKCDVEDEIALPPLPDDWRGTRSFVRVVECNTRRDDGMAALDQAVAEAVKYCQSREDRVGASARFMEMLQHLRMVRAKDASLPAEKRMHRFMPVKEFHSLCVEYGQVSNVSAVLKTLSDAGEVYFKENVFGGRVVLDMQWALDGAYVFLINLDVIQNS